MVILRNDEHPENALPPMVIILSDNNIEERAVQFSNSEALTDVTALGILKATNETQPENADVPM